MIPKEKAEQIFKKHNSILGYFGMMDVYFPQKEEAKKCALITIDVILNDCGAKDWDGDIASDGKNYWLAVKMELEKL